MGRRVSLRKIISGCFTPRATSSSCSCFWVGSREHGDPERKPLVLGDNPTRTTALRLKDIISGNQTLGFHLEPKMVTLKVSMHCDGCAKRVEKHVSKMDGVTSYKVDLENKRVVVVGDVIPVEVVESVSKVKFAELWDDSMTTNFESMDDEDEHRRTRPLTIEESGSVHGGNGWLRSGNPTGVADSGSGRSLLRSWLPGRTMTQLNMNELLQALEDDPTFSSPI